MAGHSKRTTAPTPLEFPWPTSPVRPPTASPAPPPTTQSVPLPAVPSMFAPGVWLPPRPPQSMTASFPPCRVAGVHQQGMAGSSSQGPWWTQPAGSGCSVQPTPTAENLKEYDLQAWGMDSHPPGVSSGNLEDRKLACLAAKDHKESVMLVTYRSLIMRVSDASNIQIVDDARHNWDA